MENLIYIPVAEISPHPDNPRKDLGDLDELVDSIRVNGILQNLTVVRGHRITDAELEEMKGWIENENDPEFKKALRELFDSKWTNEGGYTVIIGHRRLAAAKAAGLREVPCVIRQMDHREQVQTMLMENMQRSDLTVYEQAEGFQMMLDLGATVDEIAADSGFSTSTVRRRVKLLSLDKEKFKASEGRGATLQDYMELDKLHDPDLKNKVLDTIGTSNFRNTLQRAKDTEARQDFVKSKAAEVGEWATKIEQAAANNFLFVRRYGWWSGDKNTAVERPEDADAVNYYYTVDENSVGIYREKAVQSQQETAEERRKREMREREKRVRAALEEVEERHQKMRMAFMKDFGKADRFAEEICNFACEALTCFQGWGGNADPEIVSELLNIAVDDNTTEEDFLAAAWDGQEPVLYRLAVFAYSRYEGATKSYFQSSWTGEGYEYVPKESPALNTLYDFLTSIGYEMSDEEKAMQDGTHELFFT